MSVIVFDYGGSYLFVYVVYVELLCIWSDLDQIKAGVYVRTNSMESAAF